MRYLLLAEEAWDGHNIYPCLQASQICNDPLKAVVQLKSKCLAMLHLQPQGATADPCSQLPVAGRDGLACEAVDAAGDDGCGLRLLPGVFVQTIDDE
jgi:hypothetical protein